MRVWKKRSEGEAAASVARVALAGATEEKLLREALRALREPPHPDRLGIWLEPDPKTSSAHDFHGTFHGLVWDHTVKEDCPPGWGLLALEPPLPAELLVAGKPFEQDLEDSSRGAVIGPLVGLRRALWVPVADQTRVRGLILLGSTRSPVSPFLERAKSVAAELALAMAAEEQLHLARTRSADLALVRHIVEARPEALSPERLLSDLVNDCVKRSEKGEGLGAAFAAIGVLQPIAGNAPRELSSPAASVDFLWRSGDEVWTRAIQTEPLSKIWSDALETRQVTARDPPVTWPRESIYRIVALPLEAEEQLLGTLVAGLPAAARSTAVLDRLQLRARLAASALLRHRRKEGESRKASADQSLLDLIAEPLFLLDASGRISAASRGAQELFRPAGQALVLPSGPVSDLFCAHDREQVKRWLARSLEPSGRALKKEALRAELQNGVSVFLRFAPLPPAQLALLLEPERRSESESGLGHAEAELQNVIEWLEEGVLLFDARENVRAVNRRFEQMAGLAPGEAGKLKTLEEWIARLADQAAEPAQFAERWRELASNIQGGVREPLQMVRPAPRILERAARPMLDSTGRQVGRVEIYRDLTANRVFQSKLLQTEKLAALGQMVSGIAHELSNPLTSILGYAERLIVGPSRLPSTEEVRQIHQEAERATRILRQLLLDARETVPERRPVSLNQIVTRATELQRFSLAAGKIRVELDLDPALPPVHGDAGQLQQVLINLLNNARHALEEQARGGAIRLRTRGAGARSVLLEVEDTGPGIPRAIQARIFDPFFTTKPAGVGTGLGLSIVLSVVREHGGSVRLESPPQGGALFQIELPAASERQQADALNPAVQGRREPRSTERKTSLVEDLERLGLGHPGADRPTAHGEPLAGAARPSTATVEATKGTRVLVVEDEPTVARLIADVLEDQGMQVEVLLSGREALERAARESYDLVICDMKMPGLDGRHFYRSLDRSDNPLRERFLFVTGDVIAAQTSEFLKRHKLPHVAKPFRVEELTEKVHAVLQAHAKPHTEEASSTEAARKNAARNG